MEIDEVEKTINGWFEKTFQNIQNNRLRYGLDKLMVGVFLITRKYIRATITLLRDNHIAPSGALLRILCELYVKFLWCLNVPGGLAEKERNQKIYENFRRWDFSRIREQKRLLEKLLPSARGNFVKEIQNSLGKAYKEIAKCKSQHLKCMPDTKGIFRILSKNLRNKEWETIVYPKVYQNFSSFVHLDTKVFRELIKYEEGHYTCYDDLNVGKYDLLLYCASIACDVNQMVNRHYNWDTLQIQKEYGTLASSLLKKS